MPQSLPESELTEIAAGSMQLQPIDAQSRPGAVAALGAAVRKASAVWIARDAITALPRAYVALIQDCESANVKSAPGLDGNTQDATDAAEVVRRFARGRLGLLAT